MRDLMTRFNGFVHARGDTLVDGEGLPLVLRGVGLGNWLLPEGYMWKFGDDMSSPRQIEEHIEHLVGSDRAHLFWQRFRDVFITEADISRIAELGHDHVRLPLNSRYLITDDGTFLEEGFQRIDDLISWCERHEIWVPSPQSQRMMCPSQRKRSAESQRFGSGIIPPVPRRQASIIGQRLAAVWS